MKWNLDGAFSPISMSITDKRGSSQCMQLVRPSAMLYCAGSNGVHAEAQYLLELETIAQRLKHGEVFRCEKCASSEIW